MGYLGLGLSLADIYFKRPLLKLSFDFLVFRLRERLSSLSIVFFGSSDFLTREARELTKPEFDSVLQQILRPDLVLLGEVRAGSDHRAESLASLSFPILRK